MRFRPFFLAAALYAIPPVAVWLPATLNHSAVASTKLPLWHARELLFGMIPAAMAGFMLTAVPRWTGRPLAPRRAGTLLLPLWLAGRMGVLAAAFPLALAAIVAGNIAAAGDRRNAGPALLVVLFALAACLAYAGTPAPEAFGLRLGLASVAALQMILAGRIIPALTARHALLRTGETLRLRRRAVEWPAGTLAAAALAAWVVAPESSATLLLSLPAAATQAGRLALWQGQRVLRAPSVLALHLAYAWIPTGFVLLAWHIAQPARLGEVAAEHAWAVGGVAVLCLGIMSSMIRRHTGQAFTASPAATACYASGLLACVARLAAELAPSWRDPALLAAILLWSASYALFLRAFGGALLCAGSDMPRSRRAAVGQSVRR